MPSGTRRGTLGGGTLGPYVGIWDRPGGACLSLSLLLFFCSFLGLLWLGYLAYKVIE